MNEGPMDQLIERTLAKDAQDFRRTFATVPNDQLTAKLALSTASKGLWTSLASKFAIYTGAALVVGAAVYFMPRLNQLPSPASEHGVTSPSAIHVQNSTSTATGLSTSKPSPTIVTPPVKQPMQIDENVRTVRITDPHLQPPVK